MPALPFQIPRIRAIAVSGDSMSPRYGNGDWLFFRQLPRGRTTPSTSLVGRVVVVERESYPGVYFIKRVMRITDGGYWVEGDNREASTDSRQWGALTPTEVVGVVLLRYRRA